MRRQGFQRPGHARREAARLQPAVQLPAARGSSAALTRSGRTRLTARPPRRCARARPEAAAHEEVAEVLAAARRSVARKQRVEFGEDAGFIDVLAVQAVQLTLGASVGP